MNVIVCKFGSRNPTRTGQTGSDRVRQGQTGSDRVRQGQTGSDRVRQGQTGSMGTFLDLVEIDQIVFHWTKFQ